MKPLENATVIKESSVCNGTPTCAWYVRHGEILTGQFHSENEAISCAMNFLVSQSMHAGEPLNQTTLRNRVVFEENTAYRRVNDFL